MLVSDEHLCRCIAAMLPPSNDPLRGSIGMVDLAPGLAFRYRSARPRGRSKKALRAFSPAPHLLFSPVSRQSLAVRAGPREETGNKGTALRGGAPALPMRIAADRKNGGAPLRGATEVFGFSPGPAAHCVRSGGLGLVPVFVFDEVFGPY